MYWSQSWWLYWLPLSGANGTNKKKKKKKTKQNFKTKGRLQPQRWESNDWLVIDCDCEILNWRTDFGDNTVFIFGVMARGEYYIRRAIGYLTEREITFKKNSLVIVPITLWHVGVFGNRPRPRSLLSFGATLFPNHLPSSKPSTYPWMVQWSCECKASLKTNAVDMMSIVTLTVV